MARGVEGPVGEEAMESFLGIREGAEIRLGDPRWTRLRPEINSVLECHVGSCSLGLLEEEWFALLVQSVEEDSRGGLFVEGEFLGCEDPDQLDYLSTHIVGGVLHICRDAVCEEPGQEGQSVVHVTRVRSWTVGNFKCNYLTPAGKAIKEAKGAEKKQLVAPKAKRRAEGKTAPGKTERKADGQKKKNYGGKKKDEVISLDSENSPEEADGAGGGAAAGISRAALKTLFRKAKDRMTGAVPGRGAPEESEDSHGGAKPRGSRPARTERRIVSGTNFQPGKMTPLAIEADPALRDGGLNNSSKKTKKSRDPGDMLLAQAAQQQAPQGRDRKRKKDKKDNKKVVELLRKAVGGKKKTKKEKKKKKKKRRIKKDPDDPDGSEGSSSSSETSSSSSQGGGKESDSDLSFEPPLRKKALQSPGSVLTDLIKHAQEQMDKGALMDHEGQPASLTSGVKLSTYFALLIRPYFPNNNPLLRELYQLAQAIDLLRLGRLAETGDALASRFVAVHTAMTDGNWQVAAQLELYPLEQVQSTTTSTMLQAQKHRRLLWKAQGFSSRVFGKGRGGWPKGSGGDEKGEKGWKGKGKGKKGKNQGGWNPKGGKDGENPWKDNKEENTKKA